MKIPMNWNDPKSTWKLASFQPASERRQEPVERRDDRRRATVGDRRTSSRRSIRSLLRF